MVKIDWRNAFRQIPVHLDDHELLGCCLRGKLCYHTRLPLGLSSSTFFFNRMGEAVYWKTRTNYRISRSLHYLDTYFIVPPSLPKALIARDSVLNLLDYLGVVWALNKVMGPCTRLNFLGIQLDSVPCLLTVLVDKF